ncbi:uncharacterized protein LOC126800626 [Argentina anserina]|uniref:uncharacterized protein LOC126800626 n=1 Tax=Argentina anserina TaxID=57926 RepID=UPI0021763F42|nr:uncharacterized protein LOC126800626 [Potentilla anserina]
MEQGQGKLRTRKSNNDFYGSELEKDLLDLDDDDDVEPAKLKPMPQGYNEEQWEIKICIGLDSTLDHEEEQDEFDQLAIENGNDGDRFYMKDVNDYPIDIDSQYEVPSSLKDFTRDPRANHQAAELRIKQDAQAAALSHVSGTMDDEHITSEDAINLKSILKRKDDDQLGDSKSQKRVRFDPDCKDDCDQEPDHVSAVPDYVRNPSRYTHYTFDSSTAMDEEANIQAYMDFHNLLRKSHTMEAEAPWDFSKPVVFTPKKKSTDATMLESDVELERPVGASKKSSPYKVMPIAIAAEDHGAGDVCAMDEDEPETESRGRTSFQRIGRQFRTRTSLELDE